VAIVDRGDVIAEGTIDELKRELGQNQIIKIEGIIPLAVLKEVEEQPDVIHVASTQADNLTQLIVFVEDIRGALPRLMQNLLNHHALLQHISPATVTLEDVFIAKTGRSLNQDTLQ
jgi:ABC-2 type transport system ATP-binding protein